MIHVSFPVRLAASLATATMIIGLGAASALGHPHVVGSADPSDTQDTCIDGDPVGAGWLLVRDPQDTQGCAGDGDPVGIRPVQLANSQNHGTYQSDGTVCGGDPAAYGLESAHHGPDAGTPGNSDDCFQVDSMPPGTDDENPAID